MSTIFFCFNLYPIESLCVFVAGIFNNKYTILYHKKTNVQVGNRTRDRVEPDSNWSKYFLSRNLGVKSTVVSLCRGRREISLGLTWESDTNFIQNIDSLSVFQNPLFWQILRKYNFQDCFFYSSFTKPQGPGQNGWSLRWSSYSPLEHLAV